MTTYKKMLKDAVEGDGLQFVLDCLQEECAELITAISHLRRKRMGFDGVIREAADVQIMLDMARVGIDDEVGFHDFIEAKTKEIGDKIEFKRYNNGHYDRRS
jgi:hypothetical protein